MFTNCVSNRHTLSPVCSFPPLQSVVFNQPAQTRQLPLPTPFRFAMMDQAWSYPPLLLPCPPVNSRDFCRGEEGRKVRKARKSSRAKKTATLFFFFLPPLSLQLQVGQHSGSSVEQLPWNRILTFRKHCRSYGTTQTFSEAPSLYLSTLCGLKMSLNILYFPLFPGCYRNTRGACIVPAVFCLFQRMYSTLLES